MRRTCSSLVAVGLALGLSAQVDWSVRVPPEPPPRLDHAMAADSIRGRVVLFGGQLPGRSQNDTWEWDGSQWHERTPATTAPSPRARHAMTFDARRGRVVLFGGSAIFSQPTTETWEWDGTDWSFRTAVGPPPRNSPLLACDDARGRVVLFGGNGPVFSMNDTWEWDGSTWQQRTPLASPRARAGAQMTYDAARQRVVLFGGAYDGNTHLNDTWEYDGVTWTQRTPTVSPPPRVSHAMTYDPLRRVVVVHGGNNLSAYTPDTWEWDGQAWTLRSSSSTPTRWGHRLAFDHPRGRVLAYGGSTLAQPGGWHGTSDWDGTSWRWLRPTPGHRLWSPLAFDRGRGRAVIFSGGVPYGSTDADTWEWDGTGWSRATVASAPVSRYRHALCYDEARGVTLLFGGGTNATGFALYDTWTWDGTSWTQRSTRSMQSVTTGAMAYDARRQVVVLTSNDLPPRTFEWNGQDWTQRSVTTTPGGIQNPSLAYDAARAVTVALDTAGTWTYDGNDWTRSSTTTFPYGFLAYDSHRQRVVCWNAGTVAEWDGQTWLPRPTANAPSGTRYTVSLAYDPVRRELLLYGDAYPELLGGLWAYAPLHPAHYEAFGTGCTNSAAPTLRAETLPWIGDRFQARIEGIARSPLALLHLGFSKTVSGPFRLPLDLSPLGMPGCRMLTSADGSFLLPVAAGSAVWSIPLGNDAQTLGIDFYNQAIVLDALANPMGLLVSNGLEGRTGAR